MQRAENGHEDKAPHPEEDADHVAGNGGSRTDGRGGQVCARAQEGWRLAEFEPGASAKLATTFS